MAASAIRACAARCELGCDFYFVADVDNFIRPATLRELVALDLPIAAPLLRSITPERFYSNYHAEIDASGYYKNCDQYYLDSRTGTSAALSRCRWSTAPISSAPT